VDKLTKTMKMAIIPTAACEQHGPHLPLAVGAIDCMRLQREFLQKQVCPWFQLKYTIAPKAAENFQEHYH
jgi:creatinine amidohydrolase/Fe(II)-dependent formamide hydrolase-like protein